MTPILTPTAVEHVGGREWVLIRELRYEHPHYGLIVVPEGFHTDFDSVPRLPFAYWLAKNASVTGAVVHDWLYASGRIGDRPISRLEADRIFRDVMEEEGVSWWRRAMIYRGVRLGGWLPWGRYRDHDEAPLGI